MHRDLGYAFALFILLLEGIVLLRVMLRPQREPASRIAWAIAVIVIPVGGIVAYLLLGETRISARRRARFADIEQHLPHPSESRAITAALDATPYAVPFALARSVNGLPPTEGNCARIAADSNSAIRDMVADIDAARETVHLGFYIWLADGNGLRIRDALIRAAARGIRVRVLADALGSRTFIRSPHWRALREAGIDARVAMPVGGLIWTLIRGRVDLRNHRKQLIVDNRIAWCGSQNLADPEFRVKAKFAPWVDIMSRWEGPLARHWQFLFASDWHVEGGDDISALLQPPSGSADTDATNGDGTPDAAVPGITAQAIGTGPNLSYPAMTACFVSLIHAARRELVITTPYFVPDEQLVFALLAAGRRGVDTVMILPRRNDSRFVGGASRSYYADLIDAGVKIYEYAPGLLHAKTMVVDGEVGLIGSANLDRRSFELNFENNILFRNAAFAAQVRARQDTYLAQSTAITAAVADSVGIPLRLWRNLLAMMSPLL